MPLFIHVLHHLWRTDTRKDGHDLGNRVFITEVDIFSDIFEMFHEFSPPGQMHRFGSSDGNGLDFLSPRIAPPPPRLELEAGLFNGSGETPIFSAQSDGQDLGIGFIEFFADHFLGFDGPFSF